MGLALGYSKGYLLRELAVHAVPGISAFALFIATRRP
jgi:hypothetical protein